MDESNQYPEGEYVLLDRGLSQVEVDDGDRVFVKLFDSDGNEIFHGQVACCRIEVVGPKGAGA